MTPPDVGAALTPVVEQLDPLGVLKVQAAALGRAYLDEWARQLGVAGLPDRALQDTLG
jgi:hypothetical protein